MIGTDFDRHTSAGAYSCQNTRLGVHTISITHLQQGIRPAEHSQLTASKIDDQQNTHPISVERTENQAHRAIVLRSDRLRDPPSTAKLFRSDRLRSTRPAEQTIIQPHAFQRISSASTIFVPAAPTPAHFARDGIVRIFLFRAANPGVETIQSHHISLAVLLRAHGDMGILNDVHLDMYDTCQPNTRRKPVLTALHRTTMLLDHLHHIPQPLYNSRRLVHLAMH